MLPIHYKFVVNIITMNTTAIQTTVRLDNSYNDVRSKSYSPFKTFFAWCTAQEEHRLLWTGIILALHGCVITPATVLIVAMTGVNMLLIGISVFAMTFVLISNLAALPTKYTLPTFVASLIVDVAIIIAALSIL